MEFLISISSKGRVQTYTMMNEPASLVMVLKYEEDEDANIVSSRNKKGKGRHVGGKMDTQPLN